TPLIGAEIHGVDLANPDAAMVAGIRAALLRHKGVFFRGQTLTAQQHIAFARWFGVLEIHPATPKAQTDPELLHIEHGPNSKGRENNWHS
ncbi:TauD/TfdA dioxygenase family protein, partial [Klebsiella aerogenes]|uniref:TauD/TfdA dioxygenase family protein n=1 Tax=Klebsiella aerogenes TaxID=548 RepID=UPI001CBB40B8